MAGGNPGGIAHADANVDVNISGPAFSRVVRLLLHCCVPVRQFLSTYYSIFDIASKRAAVAKYGFPWCPFFGTYCATLSLFAFRPRSCSLFCQPSSLSVAVSATLVPHMIHARLLPMLSVGASVPSPSSYKFKKPSQPGWWTTTHSLYLLAGAVGVLLVMLLVETVRQHRQGHPGSIRLFVVQLLSTCCWCCFSTSPGSVFLSPGGYVRACVFPGLLHVFRLIRCHCRVSPYNRRCRTNQQARRRRRGDYAPLSA